LEASVGGLSVILARTIGAYGPVVRRLSSAAAELFRQPDQARAFQPLVGERGDHAKLSDHAGSKARLEFQHLPHDGPRFLAAPGQGERHGMSGMHIAEAGTGLHGSGVVRRRFVISRFKESCGAKRDVTKIRSARTNETAIFYT
jgi:hypothetical protein